MKTIEINLKDDELREALAKDMIIINEVPYMKKSRVLAFFQRYVDHLERNGTIIFMSKEGKPLKKKGILLIAQERQEQIDKHGRSVRYDAEFNRFGQFQDAAIMLMQTDRAKMNPPSLWDKSLWNKMIIKPEKERLIIAGALIAAEIDRIQYEEESL